MKISLALVAAGLLVAGGCADPHGMEPDGQTRGPAGSTTTTTEAKFAAVRLGQATARSPAPADAPAEAAVPNPAVPRKIIYNADLVVTVERFSAADAALARLIKEHGGYVAQSDVAGSPGTARSGRWVARVPVERLDAFEEAVVALGELQKRHRDSRDVTEEFFDTDARVKNKKVEESRLLKHLENSTGQLKEILEVERELSRVRGEIEQLQGHLQLLANLTSLTSVTITLTERDKFEPPKPPEVPTFLGRVARTFRDSVARLTEFGEAVALFVVAIAPWLPLVALGVLILGLITRRLNRRPPDTPDRTRR